MTPRSNLPHKIGLDIDTSSSNCQIDLSEENTCIIKAVMNSEPTLQSLSSSSEQSVEVTMEPLKICLDSDDDSSIESSSYCEDGDYGDTAPDQDHQYEQYTSSLAATYPATYPAIAITTSSLSSHSSIEYVQKQTLKAVHDATCNNDTLSSLASENCQTPTISTSILTTTPSNSVIFVPKRPQSNNDSPSSQLGSSTHSFFSQLNTSNSSSTSNKKAKLKHKQKIKGKRRSVSLHKSVSVIPIPSRCSYSPTVREKIWTSSAELCTNAARNTVEFASEGWDWRRVIEDEHMLLHQASGELIHPIHVQNAFLPISSTSDGADDFLETWNLISGLVPNNFTKNNNNATNNSNNNDDNGAVQQSSLQGVSVGPDPVPVSDKV